MKVLLVINGSTAEVDSVVMQRRHPQLYGLLAERNIDLTVALLRDAAGYADLLSDAGVRALVLDVDLPRELPSAVLRLRRLLRGGAFDVAQGDESMPALALGIAARSAGGPRVAYRRSHHSGSLQLRVASAAAARAADVVHVTSSQMRDRAAVDDHVRLQRVRVVSSGVVAPPPVDATRSAAIRAELGTGPTAVVVGVVARLRPQKGVDVAIDAVEMVAERTGRDVHLVVVGSGPDAERLREHAQTARHARVHFVGHQDDTFPWYDTFDVLVVPSRAESFSQVILEIMAAGKAVVASASGGLQHAVVDGETGYLVRPGDPVALAEALERLIEDPELAARLGSEGRRRFERCFTIEHMADAWALAWAELAAAPVSQAQT